MMAEILWTNVSVVVGKCMGALESEHALLPQIATEARLATSGRLSVQRECVREA